MPAYYPAQRAAEDEADRQALADLFDNGKAAQRAIDEELAAQRLLAIVGTRDAVAGGHVEQEVRRRTELFARIWQAANLGGRTPRGAALESVIQDALRGWL